MLKVTVWNENIQDREQANVIEIYPKGINHAIKSFLEKDADIKVAEATLHMPEHGLTEEVLDNTDVLIWWAHCGHDAVQDEIVERVYKRVLSGMGLIVLHSAHYSKIFKKLMGTTCSLRWNDDDSERLWCAAPYHPIAEGVPDFFDLPKEELYCEHFDIPEPDETVFIGWFKNGGVFRSGCTFRRGYGKIFYFQPGHESYPIYHNENIQKIITNAVHWAKTDAKRATLDAPHFPHVPFGEA